MTQSQRATVRIEDISIRFGPRDVVDNVSLHVASGEFFTLLGPSGCGKTTLLRAIAGFTRQRLGTIRIGDEVVDDVPPYRRDCGMVFQNYAIFPHLNVWENVAYGLKPRGIRGEEAKRRIREALEMVDLDGLESRSPKQLSGGQQQRVVIARAVVVRPRVLLMDEPLANLDAKLRVRLRNDLKRLQSELGVTTIYVTHDQEEALSLSDRLAVMSEGRVLQIGTPEQVFDEPRELRVARFIGEGAFLRGRGEKAGAGTAVKLSSAHVIYAEGHGAGLDGDVWVGFRPHDVTTATADTGQNTMSGIVTSVGYYGAFTRAEVDCGLDTPVSVQLPHAASGSGAEVGDRVTVRIKPENVMVFSGDDRGEDL